MSEKPSDWQQRITGEWYGRPSVFAPDGTHQGFIKVNRSSVFSEGETTYYMHTLFDHVGGALRNRLEFTEFAFGVQDSDANRIYMGPDFYGAGQPYGSLVDSNYYSPAWGADLRTVVHILPDGVTQVYSSLLYDGPTICAVFNGIYLMATDYDTNADTRRRIDAHTAHETDLGSKPHAAPAKERGHWTGSMEVWSPSQELLGKNDVVITHEPLSLVRARQTVQIEGVTPLRYSFERTRNGARHTYDGPDMFGNAISYGRPLYTVQHLTGNATKLRGREFVIDDDYSISAVWEVFDGDTRSHMTFGVLRWEADA